MTRCLSATWTWASEVGCASLSADPRRHLFQFQPGHSFHSPYIDPDNSSVMVVFGRCWRLLRSGLEGLVLRILPVLGWRRIRRVSCFCLMKFGTPPHLVVSRFMRMVAFFFLGLNLNCSYLFTEQNKNVLIVP